jgi:hypothetical protein
VTGAVPACCTVLKKHAAQKIQARSFIPLRFRMLDWKPVINKDKMYDVLALFMLMGIKLKPTLRLCLKKILFCRLQSLVLLFLCIGLNQFEILCISTTMIIQEHTRNHLNFSKSVQSCPISTHIVLEKND